MKPRSYLIDAQWLPKGQLPSGWLLDEGRCLFDDGAGVNRSCEAR